MTTIKKASQAGARRVIATLDSLASLVQYHGASLNLPKKVAMDFALRCDMVSDHLGRQIKAGYFDPSEIGTEKPGPMEYDTNNPFMAGEFTREEFRNLSEKQMAGQLAANAAKGVADPKLASVIKNAVLSALTGKKADEEPKAEEPKADEDEGKKEEETAKKAAAYNAARRAAKKADEDEGDEDEGKDDEKPEAEESVDDAEESKKTARLFQLY
jgi:hypothetical protein